MKTDRNTVDKVHRLYEKDGEPSLRMFGLSCHLPTLTLVGDTKHKMIHLQPFFAALAKALTELYFPIAVIDGATDFGVMRLFGEAHERMQKKLAAVIGVTLRTAVEEEMIPLEPHLSHAYLTQGNKGEWRAAVPVMEKVRSVITGEEPSALLAVGGGPVTLLHMREHARAGVPLYVLLGSGRLPQGFIEAQKEVPDPDYRYSLEEHKYLLSKKLTILDSADSERAIDTIVKSLHPSKQGRTSL